MVAVGIEESYQSHRGKRFIVNLLWSWMGVATTLLAGLLLSPYFIRKLGAEPYGLWALSLTLIEYYILLDLGFRSATVKYVAHYWATGDPAKINEILNTVLLYAAIMSIFLFGFCTAASAYLNRFFHVSPQYLHAFRTLVVLVSGSWCLGFFFNTFAACLEAVQRFDLCTQASAITTIVRACGTAILLYLGYGLVEIGMLVIVSQTIGYAMYLYNFRSIFPQLRLSPRGASFRALRQLGSFGIHSFVLNLSTMILNQGGPLLIGYFLPAAFVGYYSLPNRLLQYAGEAVGRGGSITNANTAELQARGDTQTLPQLAVFTNRYSVVLFMPCAIILWIYGNRIFQIWVPSIAQFSAPILPILLAGYMVAVVGQFSSGMFLLGLGRHQWYARALFAEAVLVILAMVWIIPRYGILGAAWVTSISMIANRGLLTPWLVSREVGFSFWRFFRAIYGWPFAASVPVVALAFSLRESVLPGRNWAQIAMIMVLVAASYYALALFLCLPRAHRELLQGWVGRTLRFDH